MTTSPAPDRTPICNHRDGEQRLDQATVLIVSDDAELSRAITSRWQSERITPTFTLMGGDLCHALDADAFDVAIVGGVHPAILPAVLKALDPTKPVLLICDENPNGREVHELQPRIMVLRQHEGWLDALALIVSETLRRCEAVTRLHRSEHANALLQQQAALGNYMRDMLHNLNNALTSVLGNSELLLLEPDSLSFNARSQIETIRNMALRMHEVLQRFSSLEKELKVVAKQAESESNASTYAASAGL
jgi:signal transduction histidine kinase